MRIDRKRKLIRANIFCFVYLVILMKSAIALKGALLINSLKRSSIKYQ